MCSYGPHEPEGGRPGEAPDRSELPLPDYDHLPLGGLRDRIRSLTREQVQRLVDYEEAHARRLPALDVLRHRLEQLEAGAQPSEGTHEVRPEQSPGAEGGSQVPPEKGTPPTGPPAQGVPFQTGTRKGDYQPGHE